VALGDRFYRKARDKVEVRTGEQVELIIDWTAALAEFTK